MAFHVEQFFVKTNDAGRAIVKQSEGIRLTAYRDTGGVLTIGYGHTRGVKPGMAITAEQAEAFFESDLSAAEFVVRRLVKVPLNENQFSALVSFVYNVPFEEFRTSELLRDVNEGLFGLAAAQFERWVFDDGKRLAGLVRRRALEADLFRRDAG